MQTYLKIVRTPKGLVYTTACYIKLCYQLLGRRKIVSSL